MKRSAGPFLGSSGTRVLVLAAVVTASFALALTSGVWSFKPYDPEGPPEPACPMGYHFSDGECVLVTPPTTCPDGYHPEGDGCAPDVVPTCPEGYVLSEGQCILEEPEPDPQPEPEPVEIPFEDLHGVNYVDPVLTRKEGRAKLPIQENLIEEMVPVARDAGFNVFRIPVVWESYVGNEENFLGQLVSLVETANSHDIFVWIEFHQYDATSNWGGKVSEGRGFPEFIVSCYKPNTTYESDPEVKEFWDDYYRNRVEDSSNSCRGTIDAWQLHADFMKAMIDEIDHYPNVIGYELLNEPHVWKDQDYENLGELHTELAKELRESTDRIIIFTRDTAHGREPDGSRYDRKVGLGYKILPKDPANNVMYIPHLYRTEELEDDVSEWKEVQKRWKGMGYDVRIAVGEWSPQPTQYNVINVVTQQNIDEFVRVWEREGWMHTYWAFGGFNFNDGYMLVKENGSLTRVGEYYEKSIKKFYD